MIARKVYKYPSFLRFTPHIFEDPDPKSSEFFPRPGSERWPEAANVRLYTPEYLQPWYLRAPNLSQGTKVLKWNIFEEDKGKIVAMDPYQAPRTARTKAQAPDNSERLQQHSLTFIGRVTN
ncbi:Uncharacterized protein Rs2_02045 [Raphanus sativus]|nr:Uncharacterized protein Rs2_02045 [Raphanus sativus]